MAKMTKEEKLSKQLTALQRKFVLNIVSSGMSHRQAYIKAGGRAKIKVTQDSSASTMFSNVKVKAFHDYLVKQTISDAIMTRTEILENLSDIGRTKITDVVSFGTNIKIKSSRSIKPGNARSIQEISKTSEGLKIKMHSSPAAMKQIVDMNGWTAAKEVKITGQLEVTEIKRTIVKKK